MKNLGRRFKISSDGIALYEHPPLKTLSKNVAVRNRVDEDKIIALLDKLDEREKVLKESYIFSFFVYVNRLVKSPSCLVSISFH